MITLSDSIHYFDLEYQGVPSVIACGLIEVAAGVVIVDPGPGITLSTLMRSLASRGLCAQDIKGILLTHIHFDHAGVTGALVRENPRIVVYVHERGVRHLVDPQKLVDSAKRLYGDALLSLWGDFCPTPRANVRSLYGGEQIQVEGRRLCVAYTPGHASHHLSYFDTTSGVAFVGDAAGVRIGTSTFVMPPTPPPDVDLALWMKSIDQISKWDSSRLFLTHFGPSPTTPVLHLTQLRERLHQVATFAQEAEATGGNMKEQMAAFCAAMRSELRAHLPGGTSLTYERAACLDHCYLGLIRYLNKSRGLDR